MLLIATHNFKRNKGVFIVLKVQEIRELVRLIDKSTIDEFVYEVDGAKIKMKKNEVKTVVANQVVEEPVVENAAVKTPAPTVQQEKPVEKAPEPKVEEKPVAVEADETLHKITSPMVGTFYQAPSPEEPPYVQVGTKVSDDQIVCIVEAMKLFNEIEAEVTGEIVEVLVKDGQLVEYGQPLFLVRPE